MFLSDSNVTCQIWSLLTPRSQNGDGQNEVLRSQMQSSATSEVVCQGGLFIWTNPISLWFFAMVMVLQFSLFYVQLKVQFNKIHILPKTKRVIRKKVGARERKCQEQRGMASQTDCLAAVGSPALSVIWFSGQRLSPLMNIGPSLVFLTKERELFSLSGSGKFISGIYPANTRL